MWRFRESDWRIFVSSAISSAEVEIEEEAVFLVFVPKKLKKRKQGTAVF
jgi:hypothetical protein